MTELSQLKMPEAENNGFIKTLNNMGYMTSTLDSFSKAFIDFSSKSKQPSLDVGAAYGIATIPALNKGATVIANDIDARHLEILKQRVLPETRSRLSLLPGSFPNLPTVKDDSLIAVLICRVLHFFSGPSIEEAADKLYRWLVRGGRVFVVTETPYLKTLKSFIPIYEERKSKGAEWPGLIDDYPTFAPVRGANLPKLMHFLDTDVLARVFTNAGFKIIQCNTIERSDFPEDLKLDGRESVGIIGEKE